MGEADKEARRRAMGRGNVKKGRTRRERERGASTGWGLCSKGAVTGRGGRIEFKVKKRHARNGWKGQSGQRKDRRGGGRVNT